MDYVVFNLVEGVFWVVLGLIIIIVSKKLSAKSKRLSIFSACTLVLFGISDFVESRVGSFFEPGLTWLFVWKALCVVGLVVSVVRYLLIRLHSETSENQH